MTAQDDADEHGNRILQAGQRNLRYWEIPSTPETGRLPNSIRILLENLLRNADHPQVTPEHIEAAAAWRPDDEHRSEVPFFPARVLLQDYTAVPAFVDLAAARDAVQAAGGDPSQVNPQLPVQVVVDHSLVADVFGRADARARNIGLEYERNAERYRFLRWVDQAFRETTVIPPGAGIVHQVNLEQLADVVTVRGDRALPDTVLGADSHTTMVNGLGVLGWGVGGIEAEAVMLGEPVFLRLPRVIGVELTGALPEGATATDLVLTLTELLRTLDTVGAFVEFHGSGLAGLPVPDRATIANMSPEFGSTCALFPVDRQTLRYLAGTGRTAADLELVEAYARRQGLWPDPDRTIEFSEDVRLDLGSVRPSVAGPTRPQDRVDLDQLPAVLRRSVPARVQADGLGSPEPATESAPFPLADGSVVIAAITSCTNTANPGLMLGAGLLARNAVKRGLRPRPWVKTTLAPGSTVVTDYLDRAGLSPDLAALGFHLVGYGCTTCIGNSGPLAPGVSEAIARDGLAAAAVLSGNRNFEGRIHPDVRLGFLASPPLVVAFALAGTVDIDLTNDPLGHDADGRPVYLRELWPSGEEVSEAIAQGLSPEDFARARRDSAAGDEVWRALPQAEGELFAWDEASTYIRRSPFAAHGATALSPLPDVVGARVLAVLGDNVTTDLITPSGEIPPGSPAGRYLTEHGVGPRDFNSYGARRGNHEAAARATFANHRLRNAMVDVEGGYARHLPSGETMPLFDAAERYARDGVPLVVFAGLNYGTGSSRDWAAKGTMLLGVRAVIARGFERIHRSNLIGMGVLPLQFRDGDSVQSLGLTGEETVSIEGLSAFDDISGSGRGPETLWVTADGIRFEVAVRIETAQEAAQLRHGGIIPYVLRTRWLQ
ncbi:MAG TPA: aconitate hydratase AcnA [Actinocrinis sp.]|nr:aconitate hydratase AcnA [Actinocrinis sp.]